MTSSRRDRGRCRLSWSHVDGEDVSSLDVIKSGHFSTLIVK